MEAARHADGDTLLKALNEQAEMPPDPNPNPNPNANPNANPNPNPNPNPNQGLGLQPWRAALSEEAAPAAADERATRLRAPEGRTGSGGSLQCAVEIVAPRRTVHLLPQDFFARFKLN